MANDNTKTDDVERDLEENESAMELRAQSPVTAGEADEQVEFEGAVQIATDRYVTAAFFAAAVLLAFLIGKILAGIWNSLAEWPAAVRAVPQLVAYAEDERPGLTIFVGAFIGIVGVIWVNRRADIRQWADEVATELYKVHWPDREVVTNGTIVVIVASVFATVYVGILDRIWGFITNLVYGA
jgi:preprotein translocase subunit SecE